MTKLLFLKVLQGVPFTFLSNKTFKNKNLSLLITSKWFYYLALHLKFSTAMRSSQLVEIFAYENPTASLTNGEWAERRSANSTLVYQFHNLFSQERLFIFTTSSDKSSVNAPKSLVELFACSWWLEREAGEMHGLCFEGKKDLRNLMLQYGDSSAPFRKSYPSIGLKEVLYDSVTDTLTQVPASTQI